MTETLLLFICTVLVTNSLFSLFISILSKYFEIVGTRSWSPTRIIVDNKTSENFTILDIKCKNAPGVLYKITKTLTSLGIQINTASVSTYGDRVVDIFYIKNAFGSKVDDKVTMDKIKKSILKKTLGQS